MGKSVGISVGSSVEKSISVEKSMKKSVVEKSAQKSVEKSAQKPVENSVEKSVEKLVENQHKNICVFVYLHVRHTEILFLKQYLCICVFARQTPWNIVFEVVVLLHFQKYSIC